MNIPMHNMGARSLEELAADIDDLDPTDAEILDVVMETFGLPREAALQRLTGLDLDALRVPT